MPDGVALGGRVRTVNDSGELYLRQVARRLDGQRAVLADEAVAAWKGEQGGAVDGKPLCAWFESEDMRPTDVQCALQPLATALARRSRKP